MGKNQTKRKFIIFILVHCDYPCLEIKPQRCCPPNEELKNPDTVCSDDEIQLNTKRRRLFCNCKPGYHRNDKGFCESIKKCDDLYQQPFASFAAPVCCPPNEALTFTILPCSDDTCFRVLKHFSWACKAAPICVLHQFCECVTGFYRNEDGRCVRENVCRIEAAKKQLASVKNKF